MSTTAATLANVASSATSVPLFAASLDPYAETDVLGRTVFNDSTAILYLAYAATAGGRDRGHGSGRTGPVLGKRHAARGDRRHDDSVRDGRIRGRDDRQPWQHHQLQHCRGHELLPGVPDGLHRHG